MSDMIHREDALAVAQSCPDSHWGPWIAERIAALPAVTVGVKSLVLEPSDAQVASACLSYRHDFGLMKADERQKLMFTALEWLHAWQKESAALDLTPAPDPIRIADEVFDRFEAKGAVSEAFGAAEVGEALRNAGFSEVVLPDPAAIRGAALRKALEAVRNEVLGDIPDNDEDRAYNLAIDHAAKAILALIEKGAADDRV